MVFNADFSEPYKLNLKFNGSSFKSSDNTIDFRLNNCDGDFVLPMDFTHTYFSAPISEGKINFYSGFYAHGLKLYNLGKFNSDLDIEENLTYLDIDNAEVFNKPIHLNRGQLRITNCPRFDSEVNAINNSLEIRNCAIFNKPLTFGANQWNFSTYYGGGAMADLPLFNSDVTVLADNANCHRMFTEINSQIVREGNVYIEGGQYCQEMFYNDVNFAGNVVIGNITNNSLKLMFYNARHFNSQFNIPGNATDLAYMFWNAKEFNQPVDISDGVTNCAYMFWNDEAFDQSVNIPSSVTNCCYMFGGATEMRGNVYMPESFDEPSDISYMFNGASNFNGYFSIPNNTARCERLFAHSKFNHSINIPEGITSCEEMFLGDYYFNHSIEIPDSVTNCFAMFAGAVSMNESVSIGGNVEDLTYMFYNASNFDRSVIIPSSAERVEFMFNNADAMDNSHTMIVISSQFNNNGGVNGWSANANSCIHWM